MNATQQTALLHKVDRIYEDVDGLLRASRFDEVNSFIVDTKVEDTDELVLLALLSITHAAREKLPARQAFALATFAKLEKTRGRVVAVAVTRGLIPVPPLPVLPSPLDPASSTYREN